ncbi:MAG: GTP-binding protein, partial [Chloroflexales bacterium]|nr:GTP-binding protein [Chloroflexales bacterium]
RDCDGHKYARQRAHRHGHLVDHAFSHAHARHGAGPGGFTYYNGDDN